MNCVHNQLYVCWCVIFFLIRFIKENILLTLKDLCYYKFNLFYTEKSRALKIIEKNKIKVTKAGNNILKNTEPVLKKINFVLFL